MKTKIFTFLSGLLFITSGLFAQDWVYLQSGSSAGSNVVFGPWSGDDGIFGTADDDIHIWDGDNPEREVIITATGGADGVKKYFTISVAAMWTGTAQNFAIAVNEDATPTTQPVEASAYTGTATDAQLWYVKQENGHYVIYSKLNDKVFAAGAGNGTDIELLDYDKADVKQHWTYFKVSTEGFDPFADLAEVITCTFDGGLINSRMASVNWAINVFPTELKNSVTPCNATGTINYTWEYSNDGTTYTVLPLAEEANYEESYTFISNLTELGATIGSSIFFKRIATDDNGSFDSNIIELPVVEAVDWVKLTPKSAVTVHEGDGVQALDVNDVDKTPANFDEVHLWAHRFGNEGQQMMILPVEEAGYFAIQAMNQYGSNFIFDGWDPEVKIWDGGGAPNDEKKWYVTREGDDKQYVIHVKSTWQNGDRCITADSDVLGAGVNSPAYEADKAEQQWSYLELSKDNYDPLAAYIVGDLDEGIIAAVGDVITAAPEDNIPVFNSKLNAGGGDNTITYTWEYSTDGGTTYTPVDGIETNFMDMSAFTYSQIGLVEGEGGTLDVRRIATDGTETSVTAQAVQITVDDGLSINDIDASSIKIYPNPATSSVSVSAEKFDTVEVLNALGQSVLKLEGGKDIKVNTAGFKAGIYIVKFSNNNGSVAKRLVIK
ncbi:MAG: T9SS type A sorting domain-containing protein [Bacteroidota bacterium]